MYVCMYVYIYIFIYIFIFIFILIFIFNLYLCLYLYGAQGIYDAQHAYCEHVECKLNQGWCGGVGEGLGLCACQHMNWDS